MCDHHFPEGYSNPHLPEICLACGASVICPFCRGYSERQLDDVDPDELCEPHRQEWHRLTHEDE